MKKILILCLLLFGCNKNSTSVSNEIEIDWVLINIPEMSMEGEGGGVSNELPQLPFTFNGYMLFVTNSSGILGDEVTIDDNGLLTFTYNENNYSYDISDSYYEEEDMYTFEIFRYYGEGEVYDTYCDRIILNTEFNYMTYFVDGGY